LADVYALKTKTTLKEIQNHPTGLTSSFSSDSKQHTALGKLEKTNRCTLQQNILTLLFSNFGT
jgi:hypothetical protein